MRSRAYADFAITSIILAFGLCGSQAVAQQVSFVDSVAVVRNANPIFRHEWIVGPEAVVVIGAQDGPDEYVLPNVYGAKLLSDGRIVVEILLRDEFELRYYAADGTFLESVARWGDGPGECKGLRGIERMAGDSLLVVCSDFRYAVFDPAGRVARTARITHAGSFVGTHILAPGRLGLAQPHDEGSLVRAGLREEHTSFLIHALDEGTTDTIATLPSYRSFVDGSYFHEYPFSPIAEAAAAGGLYWVGSSGEPRLYAYTSTGEHRITLELRRPLIEVTRSHRAQYERVRNREPEEYPDHLPAFGEIHGDAAGNLWVQRYAMPGSEEDGLWDIFNPGGVWIATARVPFESLSDCARNQRFRTCKWVLDIGHDAILALHYDGLRVQRVIKYPLRKAGMNTRNR